MQSAAAALLLGVPDPLLLLRLHGADAAIAHVVVAEAARLQCDRDTSLMKDQARLIRNEIAQMLRK